MEAGFLVKGSFSRNTLPLMGVEHGSCTDQDLALPLSSSLGTFSSPPHIIKLICSPPSLLFCFAGQAGQQQV